MIIYNRLIKNINLIQLGLFKLIIDIEKYKHLKISIYILRYKILQYIWFHCVYYKSYDVTN